MNSFIRNRHRSTYIGIPINLSYYFTKDKNFYVNFGGEYLGIRGQNVTSHLSECGTGEREIGIQPNLDSLDNMVKVNIGVGYTLDKEKISYFIEPMIEYSISKVFNEPIILDNGNASSLELGLRVGFRI